MGKTVAGKGPDNARIVLVGQNPGKEEAKQGRPFVVREEKSSRFLPGGKG